jgi:hypothetical protein
VAYSVIRAAHHRSEEAQIAGGQPEINLRVRNHDVIAIWEERFVKARSVGSLVEALAGLG